MNPDDAPSPTRGDAAPTREISEEELAAMDATALEDEIQRHNQLYWEKNAPEISDYDYDRLVRRLRELAPDSPVLDEIGSGEAVEPEEAVEHVPPMLSLDKCYDEETLRRWADKIDGDFVVMPKLDGVAAAIRYDADGRLVLAATRGNGRVGENITANIRKVEDVPAELPRKAIEGMGPVEVRGEVYMSLSVFDDFRDRFSNPRNLTAGAVKQKDAARTADYRLSFAAYSLVGADFREETERFDFLERLGFPPIERERVDHEDLQAAYERFAARRPELDYEIDGVVYRANRVDVQEEMGSTGHHPRYAIAYKFQGDSALTTLRDIEWSVSRTGAVTPVALVEPVELSGAVVSRASLHNAGFIEKLGLTRNARVVATRRGGVIPNVEFVAEPGEGGFEIPERCPSCGAPTRREDDFLYCSRPEECQASGIGRLAHFVSVCEVEGFGEKSLKDAYAKDILRAPEDLFTVTREDLLRLERAGEKTADNLMGQIDRARRLPLDVFLRSLGVPELGQTVSRILAGEFRSVERVRQATAEEMASLNSIGEVIARRVTEGLAAQSDQIDTLLKHIEIEPPPEPTETKTAAGGGPLAGKSFVFTGALEEMTRSDAQKAVRALGAETPSGVSKGLTHLVCGHEKSGRKSSKQRKAEQLIEGGASLEILDEDGFRKMLEEANKAGSGGGQMDLFES